ncbi:MAG: MIP/aquaporin family protein [Pseudomonadota bacterium]
MTFSTSQKLGAEALGTAFLLAIVVGSGIMGETLAGGNTAIALLANTIATGAGLVILILIFGPVSGAHFNPAVTLAFALRREITPGMAGLYAATQIAAGFVGVLVAHAMFDLEILQMSLKARTGAGQALGEAVATFGLVLTILGAVRFRPESVAYAVGLFITAGYWFTSSTSFANPAVTIARTFTDTFAGIRPSDAPMFLLAQFSAAAFAVGVAAWLFAEKERRYRQSDEGTAEPLPGAR